MIIKVFCEKLPIEIFSKMKKRLNDYDMKATIYPRFILSNEIYSTYLSFQFSFNEKSRFEWLRGKQLKSGFELYVEAFDDNKKKKLAEPRFQFFECLLGKRMENYVFYTPKELLQLKDYNVELSFVAKTEDDIFEARFAALVSAILTELTHGVCYYQEYGIWYGPTHRKLSDHVFSSIEEYEQSLSQKEIVFKEFSGK